MAADEIHVVGDGPAASVMAFVAASAGLRLKRWPLFASVHESVLQDALLLVVPFEAPDGFAHVEIPRLSPSVSTVIATSLAGRFEPAWCRDHDVWGPVPPGVALVRVALDRLASALLPSQGKEARRFAESEGTLEALWTATSHASASVVWASTWMVAEVDGPVAMESWVRGLLERGLLPSADGWIDRLWPHFERGGTVELLKRLAEPGVDPGLRGRSMLSLVRSVPEADAHLRELPSDGSVTFARAWAELEAAGRSRNVEVLIELSCRIQAPVLVRDMAGTWARRVSSTAWSARELAAAVDQWKSADAESPAALPGDVLRQLETAFIERLPPPLQARLYRDWALSGDPSVTSVLREAPDWAHTVLVQGVVEGAPLTVSVLQEWIEDGGPLKGAFQTILRKAAIFGPLAPQASRMLERWALSPDPDGAKVALELSAHHRFGGALTAGLGSSTPSVRSRAIELSVKCEANNAARLCQRGLQDLDDGVRRAAVTAAVQLSPVGSPLFETMRAQLKEAEDPVLVEAALRGAERLGEGGQRARAVLEALLPDDTVESEPVGDPDVQERGDPTLRGVEAEPEFLNEDDVEEVGLESEEASGASDEGNQATQSTPGETAGVQDSLSSPSPGPAVRASLSQERARYALQVALDAGPRGFPLMARLAEAERVPEAVRAQAVARIADHHSERKEARRILERALSGPSSVAGPALTGLMMRRDTRMEPLAGFVRSRAGPELRTRALRFVASRWSRDRTRDLLNAALEDPDPQVRRAALDGLFSSLRYVSGPALERRLVNLLEEHDQLAVQISAAVALGVFGSLASLAALDAARGPFRPAELREAAHRARFLIQSR